MCCQIATILVLLKEIVVAERDGEGSFQTGSRINAISAHASHIQYDMRTFSFPNRIIPLWNSLPDYVDVDVDVVYGRRRMPLCPPPQYNTSK